MVYFYVHPNFVPRLKNAQMNVARYVQMGCRTTKNSETMKKFLLSISMLAVALAAPSAALAQSDGTQFDTPDLRFDQTEEQSPRWIRGGVGGINISQVSLSNWAAGGESSMAFDAILNYDAIYTNRRHLWQNRLELAYGMSFTESRGARKTNDKIFLNSMYGYRVSRTWYASVLGVFSTQFAKGYNYNTVPKTYMSRFMAPGYLGIGVGATWRPNSWFSAYFSPATWRGTFVFDDALFLNALGQAVYSPYGVLPGKHLYNEFGANVRLEVNRDLWHDVHVYSRLDLFSNYLDKPQNIDVRWYTMLTARLNEWLSASLSFNVLYDDHVKFMRPDGTIGGSKIQIKEVLGLGMQMRF
jgi:hypothetical protein